MKEYITRNQLQLNIKTSRFPEAQKNGHALVAFGFSFEIVS